MPIWPFRKRRRSGLRDDANAPLSEKSQPENRPLKAATYPPAGTTQAIEIPRKSSKRETERKRRALQEAQSVEGMGSEKVQPGSQKENVPPPSSRRQYAGSREDITALPSSRKLESSPHLRPVDLERPHIPYNFRPYSTSQSSIQKDISITPASGPRKLRSRRSAYETSTPSRMQSSKRSKKEERLREEEIRAMGAHTPLPKRPGDGPLRRDSKKMRGTAAKGSYVSLPADDDIDSNMTGVVEQRGWEIGSLDMFNPRPAVRLSGTPQFISPTSAYSPSPIAEMVRKDKEKENTPASRDRARKRETIGNRADDFDASDIRMLLERDAKRREQRKKEQQEKLDRKLRSRQGRNRGDSDKKRREAEEVRRAEDARQRADKEDRERRLMTPPTDVHPALRASPADEQKDTLGLGIGSSEKETGVGKGEEAAQTVIQPEDPFTDAAAEQVAAPIAEEMPGAFSPVQTPMEDPVIENAREMRMTPSTTPPLSPVQSAMAAGSISQMMESRRASDIPAPPPPITDSRRSSDPKADRRAGGWATIFRRGGTNPRKPSDAKAPGSEASFSNTSRESMRNQPLPPHLIDTQVPTTTTTPRRKSGTPVRTQSKFREDLPEMPISPPDSRLPSPDVTTAAAAAAAARRKARSSAPVTSPVPLPEDATMDEAEQSGSYRNDTPVTPSIRSNRMASMASIDSEASWLASGSAKRHSTQSGVNRSIGSLNKRFTGSYEELGRDGDPEHFQRINPGSPERRSKLSSSALAGASPDEETEEEGPESVLLEPPGGDPMTMHESVRRQPTLIHRDPRVKSREGLLTEFAEGRGDTPEPTSAEPTSAISGAGSIMGFEDDEPQLQRASSVDYKGHARQISAGSARLMNLSRPADVSEEPMPKTPRSS